jgi:diacylglycerol kinase family enzyme
VWIESDEHGSQGPVDAAVAAGADVVVAVGGDGTVRQVGSALAGSGTPFAVIPSGTANLLARNLGIPQYDIDRAARIALGSQQRPIDLGVLHYQRIDGSNAELNYFVMAGFGIDADMVSGSDPTMKRRFGWVAYVAPIVRSLGRTSSSEVTYTLDDGTSVSGPVHTLIVGNSGMVTAGLRLLPNAILDDGLLDILAIRSMRPRDRRLFLRWLGQSQSVASVLPSLRIDPDTSGGALRYRQSASVTATIASGVTFQADGDSLGVVSSATFTVRPAAVIVRAPAKS